MDKKEMKDKRNYTMVMDAVLKRDILIIMERMGFRRQSDAIRYAIRYFASRVSSEMKGTDNPKPDDLLP